MTLKKDVRIEKAAENDGVKALQLDRHRPAVAPRDATPLTRRTTLELRRFATHYEIEDADALSKEELVDEIRAAYRSRRRAART